MKTKRSATEAATTTTTTTASALFVKLGVSLVAVVMGVGCITVAGPKSGTVAGGGSCNANDECASGVCEVPASSSSSSSSGETPPKPPTDGEGEQGADPGEGDSEETPRPTTTLRPQGTCKAAPAASSSSSSTADGGGATPSDGSCARKSGGAPVADGSPMCESNVLYKCIDGQKSKIRDCDPCKYIGAGTGSEYDTSCKETVSPSAKAQAEWAGPGCYFGFSRICG